MIAPWLSKEKKLRFLPVQLRTVTEVRHVLRVTLNGGLERPLCETVKLKPGLLWRPQDVGDAKAVGDLSRRAADREWNQPSSKKCVAVSKAERSWRSEKV